MFETERASKNRSDMSQSNLGDTLVESASLPHQRSRVVDLNAPAFEAKDLAAFCFAAVMMLGPLVVTAVNGAN